MKSEFPSLEEIRQERLRKFHIREEENLRRREAKKVETARRNLLKRTEKAKGLLPGFRKMLERPGFGICVKCLTEKPESEMQYPGKCRVCNRAWYRTWSHKKYGPPRTKLTDEELAARAAARQTARSKTGWTRDELFAYNRARCDLIDLSRDHLLRAPVRETVERRKAEREEHARGWREYYEWCAENREAIKRAAQDRANKLKRERNNTPEKIAAREERARRAAMTKKERQRWKDYKKRKTGAGGARLPWDFEERQLAAQGGRCFYCKGEVGDDFHLDHVIPVAKGGMHHPNNLVIACPDCNTAKSDLMPWEFKVAA